jgi:hypothetical protein
VDRLLAGSQERLRAHELTVFEDRALEAVRLLDKIHSGPGLREGFDNPVAPETSADIVLQLEVGVQAGNDGVCGGLEWSLSHNHGDVPRSMNLIRSNSIAVRLSSA